MKLAFIGRPGLGGVSMRAAPVARALGAPLIHPDNFPESSYWDTLVVTKYWPKGINLRARCDRLIFDPLDCWESTKPTAEPADFWRWTYSHLRYDTIIAASPSAALSISAALKDEPVKVIQSPHHADPRITSDWYDPSGPIVYAGGERFIMTAIPEILSACQRLNRQAVFRYDRDCWQALKGAAVSLCLRLPPTDTPLNVQAKPGVKIENAAAAGLCCLASNHPAITTLRPNVTTLPEKTATHRGGSWEMAILEAIGVGPLANPVTVDQHIATMREVIGVP